MAKFNVRYFTRRPRADGTMRFFWQPNKALMERGFQLERLSDDEATAIIQAQEFNRKVDEWRESRGALLERAGPLTMLALIENYRKSRRFLKLAEKTRKDSYEYAFRIIIEWAGDAPAIDITPRAANAFYEGLRVKMEDGVKIETPARAASVMRVLRILLNFAIHEGVITTNPASKMDISQEAKKGRLWTHAEVKHFVKTADALGFFSIGSAVMLNEWMGQRKGDIIAMLKSSYRDGAIFVRQSKTGAEVALPVDMIPDLSARLQKQVELFPNSLTLFPHEQGRPHSPTTFRDRFQMIRDKACETMPAMKDVVFMTLRHTAITRLAESGCDVPQIAAISGHKFRTCEQIIDRYVVRTAPMAREAFKRRQQYETAQMFPVENAAGEQDQTNSVSNPAAGISRKEK